MAQIEIKGGAETARALEGLKSDLRDLTPTNRAVAEVAARSIATAAPRRSGRLAGSFEPTADRDRAEAGSDLVYAGVIEYGWAGHNIEAQHYAERALAAAAPRIESTYREGVEKMVRRAQG